MKGRNRAFLAHYLHTETRTASSLRSFAFADAVILEDDEENYHNEEQHAQRENRHPLSPVIVRQVQHLPHLLHGGVDLRVRGVQFIAELVEHAASEKI